MAVTITPIVPAVVQVKAHSIVAHSFLTGGMAFTFSHSIPWVTVGGGIDDKRNNDEIIGNIGS